MNGSRELSDPLKKELLKLIIDKIRVEYDLVEKIHILTINFKIPVFIQEGNEVSLKQSSVVITPPKSGRNPKNQIEPVGNYSTVTDLAKLRGWSTLQPLITAIWYDKSCKGIVVINGDSASDVSGISIT